MKKPSQFRFKQFALWHHRSAMKVGVDGVLIACWSEAGGCRRILDVGTGCGLVALIMAQRVPGAEIVGVDVDHPSVEEAAGNVLASPWADRVSVVEGSFPAAIDGILGNGFDLIVSNPPYFDSGVADVSTPRERARHQGALSPSVILRESVSMLCDRGSVAMVVPLDLADSLCREAERLGYSLLRRCHVRGHSGAPFKRALLQWRLAGGSADVHSGVSELTLELAPGIPTEAYRDLCRDFYLKF